MTQWLDFINQVGSVIGIEGPDTSDNVFQRRTWIILGTEVNVMLLTPFDEAGYEDEFGIPFSTFNFELQLKMFLYEAISGEESDRFNRALARYLVLRLRDAGVGEVVLGDHKRGHSTFPAVLADLAVEAKIQGQALQPFLFASEYHPMECRGQGCVAEL